jgi:hypothetical protein
MAERWTHRLSNGCSWAPADVWKASSTFFAVTGPLACFEAKNDFYAFGAKASTYGRPVVNIDRCVGRLVSHCIRKSHADSFGYWLRAVPSVWSYTVLLSRFASWRTMTCRPRLHHCTQLPRQTPTRDRTQVQIVRWRLLAPRERYAVFTIELASSPRPHSVPRHQPHLQSVTISSYTSSISAMQECFKEVQYLHHDPCVYNAT